MAIAIGQHAAYGTPAFTTAGSITTPAKTTSASGSTFVITVYGTIAIASSTPVQDSFSNTYTLKASGTVYFGALNVYMYVCDNGSGGSGHTATANFSVVGHGAIFFDEVTGAANPSYDTSATVSNNGGGASQSGASVSTGNANDLILSMLCTNGDGATITDTAGWNAILDSVGAGTAGNATAAISYEVVSSTGTYSDTYGVSTSGGGGGITIALKAAAVASGVSVAWWT